MVCVDSVTLKCTRRLPRKAYCTLDSIVSLKVNLVIDQSATYSQSSDSLYPFRTHSCEIRWRLIKNTLKDKPRLTCFTKFSVIL